ncbi:uncharacterized protein FA14DRAFT_162426 [Meira miltonrushii]|uniref:Uncharacterized protein n=1 Tax=Meira miltonrushii TaxID=1280837 RepID=A0A316V3U3_9BASI|nr:uncharacterized protein FA14DRAFT_162426 [Meira miltonrushii]PWN32227.1 hypothetical protein FA14DRAFT_162426 [Meira miltonrushii]
MAPKKSNTSVAKSTIKSNTPAAKPRATSLILISLLSISVGIFVHSRTLHFPRYKNAEYLMTANVAKLRSELGLPKSWPGTTIFDQYGGEAWRFLLVLVNFFKDAIGEKLGQSILLLITSVLGPVVLFFTTESLKDGRHPLISPGFLIFVLSLGQLILVAAASSIVLVPAYAYTRWQEASSLVHPLPTPNAWKIVLGSICNIAALLIIFLTTFTPPGTIAFTHANILFQFFPIVLVPLLFVPRSKTVVSTAGSASARESPRLLAASNYQLLSFMVIPIYWLGLYWGGKPLFHAIIHDLDFKSDGPYLLFWDLIGVLSATYAIVQIDAIVDGAKVKQGGERIHSRRLFLEDAVLGLPIVALLGPGWAISRYFQRREILAEKVRFGATAKED